MPKVSIGLPVYNGAKFIRNALDTLLAQSFGDFELIISDNCSTDDTEAICKEYSNKDSRIRYIKQPENIGISRNMEFLLHQARGEFFMWAADDDLWAKDFLQTLLAMLEENTNLVVAFCPFYFIDEESSKPIEGMKIRSVDYSGRFALYRLIKLCYFYDDGCGYGLFRRKLIEDVHLPVWWSVNKLCAFNNMYPPIFYFLSVGDFRLTNLNGLWEKRLRIQPRHIVPFSEKLFLRYVAYLLMKINVVYQSLDSVYKGSNSFLLVIAITPFVFLRFIIECLYLIMRPGRAFVFKIYNKVGI